MATQFDATARISVDLRGFSQAANEVTRGGGVMTKVFQNLHRQLNQIEAVNKKTAKDLQRTATTYNSIARAAQAYATALTALAKAEANGANGAKKIAAAFGEMRKALAGVQGLSAKESERLGRTVNLYNQLASALQKVARSYQIIRSVGQMDTKLAQSAERQAQAAQRLAIEQQRLEVSAQRAANAQRRLNAELQNGSSRIDRFGSSSFALRSSLGEIEQQGQSLVRVFLQIGTTLAASAISQEQAFAQVARVVGETQAEAVGLNKSFQDIAANFPISFEEVARVGQLGAQIGVSADELDGFTRTVAKFALTTGVSAEETTLLLGRIAEMQNVPISQMENLGSAVLALGTASAATEKEILRINESIATVSNIFGLSEQAVTGLASALATLRVRPELARGSLTRVFGELDEAIQSGGQSLGKLAKVMNMTGKEVVNLRNTNPDDFFLAFIKGLGESAKEAGGFQQVIRDLGINAVRDIDTLSRLGNNYDVLANSFSMANLEWAKGSELQRQSQGIFDTTAARLQNLSDEFKNFAAQAGGPLAEGIGVAARVLSNLLEFLTGLGPVAPILGTLTALVVAGGIAWAGYQVVLAKTVQSMIATRELQRNLGVSTLTLSTAWRVYRQELGATAPIQASTVGSMRGLSGAAQLLSRNMNAAAASNALYARSAGSVATSSAAIASNLRANGAAVAAATAANRNYALTTAQMATANTAAASAMAVGGRQMTIFSGIQNTAAANSAKFATSTAAVATNTAGLNRTTSALVPTLTAMNTQMLRAATAGNAMGAGMGLAATRSAQAATAATAVAGATARAGIAARAASLAFGPWGLALAGVLLILGPMVGAMTNFSSAADRMADSAMKAAGGQEGLANALREDTATYEKTGKATRVLRDAYADLSDTNQQLALSQLKRAKAERESVISTAGTRKELEGQAKAGGEAAATARVYIAQLDKAEGVIKRTNEALNQSTVAFGEQSKMWLTNATQSALATSKLADGSDLSKRALKQLGAEGVDVGKILQRAFKDPEGATKQLDGAVKELNKTITAGQAQGLVNNEFGKSLIENAASAQRAKDFLEALNKTISASSDEALKAKTVQELLGASLKEAGQAAVVSGGQIELTADNLEDLETSADDVDAALSSITETLQGFGTPLTAFQKATERSMAASKDGVNRFSLSARGDLNLFLKELDKIATAQQNWSANLVKISGTLGTEIAQGLASLGVEAAPMIAQLANLTTAELLKLKPRLAAIGQESSEALAGGLLKGMASLQGVSNKARGVIASGLGQALKDASSPEQFNKVVNAYSTMIDLINSKKVSIPIVVNALQAGVDINKFVTAIQQSEKLKIKPQILFDRAKSIEDFNSVFAILNTLAAAKKAKIDIDINDAPAKLSLQELEKYIRAQEVAGLLDAKGKGILDDGDFRKKVQSLATLMLGRDKAGSFDANGDGKFNDKEFRKLFDYLMGYIKKNRPNFNIAARANLTDNVSKKVGGIVQALNRIDGRVATSYAAIYQTTYRNTVNTGTSGGTMLAADGGYITGPGGPRDDKIPARLSDGEYVINAAATKKHRALLDQINSEGARSATRQPYRYANGGPVHADKAMTSSLMRAATTMDRAATRFGNIGRPDRTFQRSIASGPVITVNNTYPRDEPTSLTINRALAFAATLNGV